MLIKVRCSKNGEWAFLEKYETYNYLGKGYISAITSITKDGVLAPSFVFRGGDFVPLDIINEEVGVDRYVKAKKPFYAKINGGFCVLLKAYVDFENKVYYPEKSSYEVYIANGFTLDEDNGVPFKKVLDVPKEFDNLVKEPLRVLGESFGSRVNFLISRSKVDS